MPSSVGNAGRGSATCKRLTNNTRLLVLPWVDGAASGQSSARVSLADGFAPTGRAKYGHPVDALETFVDRSRFRGTCYRAANWVRLGSHPGAQPQ